MNEKWLLAEKYLKMIEAHYTAAGSGGYIGLLHVIRPLRDRFNRGEKTRELWEEIMALE